MLICNISNFCLLALLLGVSTPSAQRRPAIDLKRISCDVRRSHTRDEQHQTGKVLWLADPATRLTRRQGVLELLHAKCGHAAGEDTRADHIHSNVLRHEFRRLHLREMDACCFRWAVRKCAVTRGGKTAFGTACYVGGHDAGHRSDVDDARRVMSCGAFGQ
jgi:hypothetical protein